MDSIVPEVQRNQKIIDIESETEDEGTNNKCALVAKITSELPFYQREFTGISPKKVFGWANSSFSK